MENEQAKTGVFISYARDDVEIARKLYMDLKKARLNPWFDEKNLLPGHNWKVIIHKAMKASAYVLVLFSSKSVGKRGFAQKELKIALDLLDEFPSDKIFIIPVRVDKCESPDIRLEDIHQVDLFPSYKTGLDKILRVFKTDTGRKQHEQESVLPLDDSNRTCEIGTEMKLVETEFINELFERFYTRQAVLLLGQRDREQGQARAELMRTARDRFDPENVLSIVPFRQEDLSMEEYFEYIGEQCGAVEPVKNSFGFVKLIQKRLAEKGDLFLLIIGFERGSAAGGKALAGGLRNLMDSYSANLKLMVCGGERLADLYFVNGREFSFLNSAEAVEWPEFTIKDVRRLCRDQVVDDDTARKILEISGGHPRLLQVCLDFCRKQGQLDAKVCKDSIENDHYIWHLFTEFLGADAQTTVYELLEKDEVWPYQPYIIDPLVRRFYWQNLLKRNHDQRQLIWRCEIIRKVGKQILGETSK